MFYNSRGTSTSDISSVALVREGSGMREGKEGKPMQAEVKCLLAQTSDHYLYGQSVPLASRVSC